VSLIADPFLLFTKIVEKQSCWCEMKTEKGKSNRYVKKVEPYLFKVEFLSIGFACGELQRI